MSRLIGVAVVLAAATATVAATSAGASPTKRPLVPIQILALNDFHGQLEPVNPLASSGGRIGPLTTQNPNTCSDTAANPCVPAGGVEYLATHVRNLRAENPNTVFASAGDLIGATPLLSALFHDEPTIEAFNLLGLDYNGVGNHEFDEGVDELLRMQFGNRGGRGYSPARPDGCHPVDGCGDLDGFGGADFEFLAANVVYRDSGRTIFPPYAVHNFPNGVKVAFVGMTLEGTPLIVSPDGITTIDFRDEAESVNALVPHLKRRGVEAIVVLLHEGGSTTNSNGTGSVTAINQCNALSGNLPPIVDAMDDEIDIVITGHTNWAVNCIVDGKVVTGAASQGRLITDIDAMVDPVTRDFVDITVNNRIVTQGVAPAADLTALMDEYRQFSNPIASVRVGAVTETMDRNTRTLGGESTLGRLIADAQVASAQADGHGTQIAFMNPGGIRANLAAGDVSYGQAFDVQPFSNVITTKSMTGAQIEVLLEQQWTVNSLASPGVPGTVLRSSAQILQVSGGFEYAWSLGAPAGQRVDPASIKLNGVVIDPAATYRVTMNSFLASGGDDFPVFTLGTDTQIGDDDLVALVAYLGANDPYTPVATDRITRIP
jgi:5'-nucleotidase